MPARHPADPSGARQLFESLRTRLGDDWYLDPEPDFGLTDDDEPFITWADFIFFSDDGGEPHAVRLHGGWYESASISADGKFLDWTWIADGDPQDN